MVSFLRSTCKPGAEKIHETLVPSTGSRLQNLTHALSHPIHEKSPTTGQIRPSKWDATSEIFIPEIVHTMI
jgi:hypothetical protein